MQLGSTTFPVVTIRVVRLALKLITGTCLFLDYHVVSIDLAPATVSIDRERIHCLRIPGRELICAILCFQRAVESRFDGQNHVQRIERSVGNNVSPK